MKIFKKSALVLGVTLLTAVSFASCNSDQEDLEIDSTITRQITGQNTSEATSANRGPVVPILFATLAIGQTGTFDTLERSFDPEGDTITLDSDSVFGGRPNDVEVLSDGRIRITRRSTRASSFLFTIIDSKGARTQSRIRMFALRPGSF